VQPANHNGFSSQQIAHHARTGKGIIPVQLVDPAHQRQIMGRYRTGPGIDACPADPEFAPAGKRRVCDGGQSSLDAQQAGLGERTFQKCMVRPGVARVLDCCRTQFA
jgi:hypothetical protein